MTHYATAKRVRCAMMDGTDTFTPRASLFLARTKILTPSIASGPAYTLDERVSCTSLDQAAVGAVGMELFFEKTGISLTNMFLDC